MFMIVRIHIREDTQPRFDPADASGEPNPVMRAGAAVYRQGLRKRVRLSRLRE